jgi:ATP-binding cassette subfamily C protein
MRAFVYFARRYPWETAGVVVCVLLGAALEGLGISVALPLVSIVTGAAPDTNVSGLERRARELLAHAGLDGTGELLALVAVAFWLKGGVMLFLNARVGYMVAHVASDLRLALLRALLSARWRYYTRQPVGVIANAMASEADRSSRVYYFATLVLTAACEFVLYVAIALAISWRATLAAAVAGGLTIWLLYLIVAFGSRAGGRQTRLMKSLLGRLTDVLQSVKLLKATGRESLVGPLIEKDTRKLENALRKQVLSKELLGSVQEPFLVSSICLGVFVASVYGDMPNSTLLVLMLAFVRILTTVNKGQRRYQYMAIDASALWSLRALIEGADADAEPRGGTREPTLERGLALRDVRVEYAGRAVLDGLTLELPARSLTAIIGASGTGKTTIVDLLTGLVEPASGGVWVDGIPLRELDLPRWRRLVGYVPQEMLLLHDTIAMNVTLGDPALGPEDVERALREAHAWEFVSQLPEGVNSSVGERGTLLSGGQRQRIAIARALAHRPKLLILDEATTALDPRSEAAVWEAVSDLRGKTTVVAISHQPALADVADRIYRIHGGRVQAATESGACSTSSASR